jgi:3-hydroxyisobutyrate dehydrogenase-like beta-hydroxyacid dehydrogenase
VTLARSRIAVFGIGEAGSLIAADLAALGAVVTAFDPADVATPPAVRRTDSPADAVRDADVVLAVTAAADAHAALDQAAGGYGAGALYADLSTASPGRKRELAVAAATQGLLFADVALMSTVPGKGLRTPALVSGPGATRYAALVETAQVAGQHAGDAATRKLLRSVVMKGLAALVIEAMRGAHAAGLADETFENVVAQLTDTDEAFVRRLVEGTKPHALRRLHEMEATSELLAELGVEPLMTAATTEHLRRMLDVDLPPLPPSDYSATSRSSQ